MLKQLHAIVDGAVELPGVVQWRRRRFDQAFAAGGYGGNCRGVFATYAEAAASAPPTFPIGYDHEEPAAMYRDRLLRVFPSDYPMMLWLQKIFNAGAKKVFDLGGHVGVGYYAYQAYIAYPSDLQWQICDVPAVVASGKELALKQDYKRILKFTDSFKQADGCDVLFTSGCIQYLEDTLAVKIAGLASRPKWVLVNLLPLHETYAFWTLQSIGRAFCPYRIQRAATFFSELDELGYELVDEWENLEKKCDIAFEPERSLDRYVGAAFRLRKPVAEKPGKGQNSF